MSLPPGDWASAGGGGGPGGYWAITRYDDVATVSRDGVTFRAAQGNVIWDWPPELAASFKAHGGRGRAEHSRLRRILSRAFAPKVPARLDAVIAEEAKTTVDRIIDSGEHRRDG